MKVLINADRPLTKVGVNATLIPRTMSLVDVAGYRDQLVLVAQQVYNGNYTRNQSDLDDTDSVLSSLSTIVQEQISQAVTMGSMTVEEVQELQDTAREETVEQADAYSGYDEDAWKEAIESGTDTPAPASPADIFNEENEDMLRDAEQAVQEAKEKYDEAATAFVEAAGKAQEAAQEAQAAAQEALEAMDVWSGARGQSNAANTFFNEEGEKRTDAELSSYGIVTHSTNAAGDAVTTVTTTDGTTVTMTERSDGSTSLSYTSSDESGTIRTTNEYPAGTNIRESAEAREQAAASDMVKADENAHTAAAEAARAKAESDKAQAAAVDAYNEYEDASGTAEGLRASMEE